MAAQDWFQAVEDFRGFISSRRWTFAKTMPKHPHEYTVRKWDPDEVSFERAVAIIREHGYPVRYGGRHYVYLDVDGNSYWTMGAPVGDTTVLNRAVAKPYRTALKRGVRVEAPPLERCEVPGGVALTHDLLRGDLPPEFGACDVLYAEPPWSAGAKRFDESVGVSGRTYRDIAAALTRIVEGAGRPVALVVGAKDSALLPEPERALPLTLNGDDAVALLYGGIAGVAEPGTAEQLLGGLARSYRRVGDFCCGYGRSGRAFRRAGGEFVLSDYDGACVAYVWANAPGWEVGG